MRRNFWPKVLTTSQIPLSKYTKKESLWYEDTNYVIEKRNRLHPTIHKYFKIESRVPNAVKPNPLNTPTRLTDSEHVKEIIKSNVLSSYETLSLQQRPYIHGFSKRVGLVGFKSGMMSHFDHVTGKKHPVTIIRFEQVQSIRITSVGARRDRGLCSIDVGAGEQYPGNMAASRRNYYTRFGIPFKKVHMCFSITKDAVIPPGTLLFISFRNQFGCCTFCPRSICRCKSEIHRQGVSRPHETMGF